MTDEERVMIFPDLSRAAWRTSSYSSTQANCVQVAWVDPAGWRTSSYSSSQANCVEVAMAPEAVAVRDSKNADGPVLAFPATAWGAFLPR